MDWKALLALAVLVLPLAYCQVEENKGKIEAKVECVKAKGDWSSLYGGSCTFKEQK